LSDSGPVADPATPDRPTVLYIAGSGRSGSTLLERMVGAVPGFVNVGELIDVFRRVYAEDELCGCGEKFSECAFWTGVGKRAFGGWNPEVVSDIGALQHRVARQRHLPTLTLRPHSGAFGADLDRYAAAYRSLYDAILAESGARYVVDASKWPVQAMALGLGGLDVRVLHLVRDPRGVAFSLDKREIQRPHSTSSDDLMTSGSVADSAARWLAVQSEVDLLRTRGIRVTRVSYEGLIGRPRETMERLLHGVGLTPQPGWLDHVSDDAVELGPSHGVSGNPSRFRHGATPLRLDEAWRRDMTRPKRAVVSTIAAPQQLSALLHSVRGGRQRPSTSEGSATMITDTELTTGPGGQPAEGDWPLVSVILATRGRPELVRETLASIVAQDYPGQLEILVIHDQEPPDITLAESATPTRTIRILENDRHSPGLAGARNTGVEQARGAFIATCDDDDLWHPIKLSRQIAYLNAHPDLLVVGAGIRLLMPEDRIVEWPGRSERVSLETLLRNRVKELHSSTLVMRADTFAKAGTYDETLPHGYAEDYDFVLKVARVGRIGIVVEPLADIRKNVQSWFRERAENTASALEHMLVIHPELKTSRRGYARILGQIAFARSTLGQRRRALGVVGRALVQWPVAPHAYLALFQITTGADPRRMLKIARIFGRGLS
jgi:glycosyltransferase involved in cell wall biosynthesis